MFGRMSIAIKHSSSAPLCSALTMEISETPKSWSAGRCFNSFLLLTPFGDILSFAVDFCHTVPPYVVV